MRAMNTPEGNGIIRTDYGASVPEIEATLRRIIEEFFLDKDGFIYACINSRTLEPFRDSDPEVNQKPIHESWVANGSFPYDLKRTFHNYEDSDMAAGDYLMALMSRQAATKDAATANKARAFFRAMVKLYDTVAEKSPYGAGFLPKPYSGIDRAHESFETSADQYFKFTVSIEKYGAWTTDPEEKAKTREMLLAFARWMDDRDFVTSYMGDPSWGRLIHLMHYLGYFAYIMALGYRLAGNDHYRQEALFFRDRMMAQGSRSPSPNSLNLVVEILDRLVDLMPEHKEDWLELMARDWDNRHAYVNDDGVAHFSGYTWNCGARMASTYNTIVKHFPEKKGDLDLTTLLSKHNRLEHFILQIGADDPKDMTYPECRYSIVSQYYACWLRAHWES